MIGNQSAGEFCYLAGVHSLVPRSHPLTRKDSLVNQVKFLELVLTFAIVPATLNTFCTPPTQKIMGYAIICSTQNFTVVRKIILQFHFSLKTHLVIGPRNLTMFIRLEVAQWSAHKRRAHNAMQLPLLSESHVLSLCLSTSEDRKSVV